MPLQIRLREKSFAAKRTWKRLLFQMSEGVIVMMVSVHEAFPTYLTYKVESLLMALHMELIVICGAKLFSALFLLTRDYDLFLKQIIFDSPQSACISNFKIWCKGQFIYDIEG